ncbi:dCTP deaminase [Leptospira fletcheri]|uniref:dCTP deaminase n=1 Tax=Leptospira fletcheri TaxID=2484981 RepID=A0A4R9GGA9_9LEPT|nr:dCTP deaminase [Leptospira fletcheri]TGK11688.1 dCTP deaminase [Leptospira fletcheri]
MILTGKEIKKRIGTDILIDPYSDERLNPNSYNLRLYDELLQYTSLPLDMKKPNEAVKLKISESGLELKPGILYLGRTVEYTETHNLVPMLEGRSSIGRLGMYVHVTAGFGDVGFKGFWTLEISVIQPLVIYPNVEICQIFYHTVEGEITEYKSGKYQGNKGIQTSMLYKDFENGKY